MNALPITSADLDKFRAAWSEIDPAATGMISGDQVPQLLAALPRHLGFDELAGEDQISVRELRLPDLPDGSKGGYVRGTQLDEKMKKRMLRSQKSVGKRNNSKEGAGDNDLGKIKVVNPLVGTSQDDDDDDDDFANDTEAGAGMNLNDQLDEKTQNSMVSLHKSVGKRNNSKAGAADKASGRIQIVNPLLADSRNFSSSWDSADGEQGASASKDNMMLGSSEDNANPSMTASFDQQREKEFGYNFFGARIILPI